MRISDYFVRAARLHPDRVALRDREQTFTYAEGLAYIDRVANALMGACAKGAHIAIYSPNDCRVSLLQLAINRADLAWISMHPGNSGAANAKILQQFGCALLFYHPAFAARIEEVRAVLPDLRLIAMDEDGSGRACINTWAKADAPAPPRLPEQGDEICILQPTGGTTGRSKGVVHTHRSLEACILAFVHEDYTMRDCEMLAVAPLTHAAGIRALSGLAVGGAITVLPAFDVQAVLETIARYRITSIFLPPTALYAILDHPLTRETDLSSLNNITVGAAPMSPDRFRQAIAVFGPILHEAYGQTEALAPLTYKSPRDYLRPDGSLDEAALASIGRPAYNAHVHIMDDEGRLLPIGQEGEIVVRCTSVMKHYFNDPKATEAVSRFGWHHTEDVGRMDERGFITLLDRKKDMIISGGFNIYPAQVEAAINAHPSVAESIVIGVPDEKWGEAVKAVVQRKPGAEVSSDEILDLCRERLGRIYAPRSVESWDTLPRNTVGKLLRRVVRDQFWQGVDRRI
jgi:acyl-CoA synthetase (AMP-forming)/AMP-acid ligase II